MNTAEPRYRHEYKYVVSDAQVALLRGRVAHLMRPDEHAGPDGGYGIRSLYFDDYDDRCRCENEDGTDPREKFRIRIYDRSPERITLECKRKERGKTLKTACLLTETQARLLMRGQPLPEAGALPPLLRKLTLEMRLRLLRPVVIVEYDRIPYVYSGGNVRVTFDTNLSSSAALGEFLSGAVPGRPVMPRGRQLLEVKFDEYLPDFIYRSLNLGQLQRTAYSKYYLCRRYALHGRRRYG